MVWVAVKTAAGLPASEPSSQRLAVESRKYFNGAAILPKRVGLPSISASARRSSSRGATGGPRRGARPGDGLDAAACLPSQLGGAAVARVIHHEYFAHRRGV